MAGVYANQSSLKFVHKVYGNPSVSGKIGFVAHQITSESRPEQDMAARLRHATVGVADEAKQISDGWIQTSKL